VYKIGLKLWSINKNYIEEAKRLYSENVFNYIELFAVPDSYNDFVYLWKELDIPYIIHAPHFSVGMNLAKKECFKKNIELAKETFKFAKDLSAKFIIFHPGIDGDIQETVGQLNKIKEIFEDLQDKILIENKPYYALVDDLVCNGNSPEDIEFVMQNTNVGFCLDIGHAIYSANAKKINQFEYLQKFMKLKPQMFHLCDGDFNGVYDGHKHIEDGNFDLKKIINLLPKNSFISIETPKDSEQNLFDFEKDVRFLKNIIQNYV